MPRTESSILADCLSDAIFPGAVVACERDLRAFIRLAWHVTEPATPFIPGWHLDAVCEHLMAVTQGQIRNLLINIPPRHMKSLAVGVFWPAWEWIAAPQRRWLFASYALSLSERDSVKCRRLIESPWYQAHWGDRFALTIDQNTKLRYDNTLGGHRIATSVGGAATGEGGDRVVVDDPHNVIERESEAARITALTWWDETMSTRLNDPRKGSKIIVMQRVHEKDLSGHVLEQGGYVHLCLPAEFEPPRRCVTSIGWSDPRRAERELLWPGRIGPAEIAELKVRLGPEGYAGQFQQSPAPAGGARFRAEWFRYFETSCGTGEPSSKPDGSYFLHQPDGFVKTIRERDCRRIAVMDPAGTEAGAGRRPCYTVIHVWDVTPAGDMLLIHQYRQQVQAPDAAAAAVRICRDFDAEYIAIEKDGMGLGVVQQVQRSGIPVRPIKARGGKAERSQTAEIRMSAGKIYLPRGAAFLFELETELLQFPRSEYADQVDALSHAAIQVQKMGREEQAEEIEEPTNSESADEGWD